MLALVLRSLGFVLGAAVLGLGGLYGYVAVQTGTPAAEKEFFKQLTKRPLVIAHRGGGGQFPENTLYAFRESAKLDVDILELDIHQTSDGAIVVLHDRTVDRTTDGSGEIKTLTFSDARKLDAAFDFTTDGGATFPLRGKGIRIPTLEEVLDALPDKRFNIEIKPESETLPATVCSIVRERGLLHRVIIASANRENLGRFRAACPETATSGSFAEVSKFVVFEKTGVAGSFSPDFSSIQTPVRIRGFDLVTADYVKDARKLNLRIHVWTVNDAEEMKRLIALGVDGIMTDYPERLLPLVK